MKSIETALIYLRLIHRFDLEATCTVFVLDSVRLNDRVASKS